MVACLRAPACAVPVVVHWQDDECRVRLLPGAIDHPRLLDRAAVAWADRVAARRVRIDLSAVVLANSVLLNWLLRVVEVLGPSRVVLDRVSTGVGSQLRQAGFLRVLGMATEPIRSMDFPRDCITHADS